MGLRGRPASVDIPGNLFLLWNLSLSGLGGQSPPAAQGWSLTRSGAMLVAHGNRPDTRHRPGVGLTSTWSTRHRGRDSGLGTAWWACSRQLLRCNAVDYGNS